MYRKWLAAAALALIGLVLVPATASAQRGMGRTVWYNSGNGWYYSGYSGYSGPYWSGYSAPYWNGYYGNGYYGTYYTRPYYRSY